MVWKVSRSLFISATLKPGSKSRGIRARGMRSRPCCRRCSPSPLRRSSSGRAPPSRRGRSPSIIAALFTHAIMLLMAFTVLPAPDRPHVEDVRAHRAQHRPRLLERRRVAAHHDGQRGRARPGDAAADRRLQEVHAPRLGHAARSCAASRAARCSGRSGWCPAWRARPGRPRRGTWPPRRATRAARSARSRRRSTTSCAEAARLAPAWMRFSMALGFMSNTVIEKPAFSTLPAIGLPMFPTPMNPTERAIARLLWRDWGSLRESTGTRRA